MYTYIIMEPTVKSIKQKKYYEDHKDVMKTQIKDAIKRRIPILLLKKLNNNEYKRIPYSKLTKHNIKFNDELNKYV